MPAARERMRHVAHLVALAEPDDAREIVLDDAEVVLVIRDVRGQRERVAPPDDALLAEVGRAPVHFQRELIGANDLGRIGKVLADLREEGEIAVRGRVIVAQRRVGQLLRAPLGRALHELARAVVVPCLRAHRRRNRAEHARRQHAARSDREDSAHEWKMSSARAGRGKRVMRTRALASA